MKVAIINIVMTSNRLSSGYTAMALLALLVTFAGGCGAGGGGGVSGTGGNSNSTLGKDISGTNSDSYKPVIATDSGGHVFVAWEEEASVSSKEIHLAISSDAGSSFSTKKGLSKSYCSKPAKVSSDVSMFPGGDGSLYMVWKDDWPSQKTSEVKFLKEDGQSTSCKIISTSFDFARNVYSPHIGLIGSKGVQIVWEEERGSQRDIFYNRSEDGGTTFLLSAGPVNISDTPSSDSSGPLLAFEGSLNVNALWVEGPEGARSVAISRSANGSDSFPSPQTISDISIDSYSPEIGISLYGDPYITYKDDSSIYFTGYQVVTTSFSPPQKISSGSLSPSHPEMVVSSNGTLYVVWSDSGGIWVAVSTDGGYSFAPPKDISPQTGTSSSPKIVASGSYVTVVWEEEDTGGGDIFLSSSGDNGDSFSSPANLSNNSSISRNPVIASDGTGYIHVAWEDGPVGNRDIYYKKIAQ